MAPLGVDPLGILIVLVGGFLGVLLARPRRRNRRRKAGLRYLSSEDADRQARRQANWFTGRYHGGLTAEEWAEGRTHVTQRGERVRSRAEVLIADHLHANGHAYEYEPRVCGFRPDFLLPEHRIVVEYWGTQRKGHPKRTRKTAAYLQAGYKRVSLEPGKDVGLETDLRRQLYYKLRER